MRTLLYFTRYGHMTESGAHMLYYDQGCCHIQGAECEWVACKDVMLSVLADGTGFSSDTVNTTSTANATRAGKSATGTTFATVSQHTTVAGLYAASPEHVVITPGVVPNGSTILIFQAVSTQSVSFAVGCV